MKQFNTNFKKTRFVASLFLAALVTFVAVYADENKGFNKEHDSAPESVIPYRSMIQNPEAQVLLAKGLHVKYLTRNAGNKADLFAFFPAEEPTHLIACVEGGRELIAGADQYNPSVQRVNLTTGEVDTMLRGIDRCDGIRLTAWGTILVIEETDDRAAYEILNPLEFVEQTALDPVRGLLSDPIHIAKRSSP